MMLMENNEFLIYWSFPNISWAKNCDYIYSKIFTKCTYHSDAETHQGNKLANESIKLRQLSFAVELITLAKKSICHALVMLME